MSSTPTSRNGTLGRPRALACGRDQICLEVAARRLELPVDAAILARRHASWPPLKWPSERRLSRFFRRHVTQTHERMDFKSLVGGSGGDVRTRLQSPLTFLARACQVREFNGKGR